MLGLFGGFRLFALAGAVAAAASAFGVLVHTIKQGERARYEHRLAEHELEQERARQEMAARQQETIQAEQARRWAATKSLREREAELRQWRLANEAGNGCTLDADFIQRLQSLEHPTGDNG